MTRDTHGRADRGATPGSADDLSADASAATSPSRRGVLAASAAAGLGLLGAGCGSSRATPGSDKGHRKHAEPSPHHTKKRPELPRGGRTLFPRHRLVGYCGLPGATALGRLGIGDPEKRIKELTKTARSYADGREPLPVLELLATVTNSSAGPDGKYRSRTSPDTIGDFHKLARKHDAMLLLNIQPGRAAPLDEVKALRKWLVHPDVGVALDPEWDMGQGEIPGRTYGHTDGSQISDIADYLSGLVDDHDLPQKPLVFHQVAPSVVPDEHALRPARGVALIKSADGLGSPELKRATWHQLVKDLPRGVHTGFKLFYDEDTQGSSRLMTPKEVLDLKPRPEYVMYE